MRPAGSRLLAALVPLLVATAITAAPWSAEAQTVETDATAPSPQHFAVEARFGPYTPDVDSNLGESACGGGPYEAVFGNDGRLLFELEFDYQAFRFFIGSFAVGVSLGVFNASANAFEQGSCTRSDDETGLWVMPATLLAVLRFDYLATEWRIPLVPYFKFGVSYALWWATDTEGVSESTAGDSGYGGTAGLRLAGGVMFQLDWLEPRAARTFDNEWGVNHSYIFFEWYWAWLDGFGDESRMNLSDSTWVAGLALEF